MASTSLTDYHTTATLVTPDVQGYQLSFSSTTRLSFIASIACWLRRLLFIVSFTAYRLTFIALCLLAPVSSSLSVYSLRFLSVRFCTSSPSRDGRTVTTAREPTAGPTCPTTPPGTRCCLCCGVENPSLLARRSCCVVCTGRGSVFCQGCGTTAHTVRPHGSCTRP